MTSTGATLTGKRRTVTAQPMKVITALMRDPNRIHFDLASVTAAGMGTRLINQGPLSAAYVMQDCIEWFGPAISWASDITYRANALAGDDLICTAVVTSVASAPEGCCTRELHVTLADQLDRTILDGTVTWTTADA